ncbi:MAG: dihydrofolate reductase family protein [Devosia sp.]|nr:dihydrofolate reductase family protein [Devosia sp.]
MTPPTAEDRRWLEAAARQATPYLGTTGGRPTVGSILVDPATRKLLGRAVTGPGGSLSAATQAIAEAADAAPGATLYLTLGPEPESGGSGPTGDVDAVLAVGIARVVVGVADPGPGTAGQGIERWRAAGIDVVIADDAACRRLHEGHFSRCLEGRPFVTCKLAISADDKVGRFGAGRVAIVGEAAERWTEMQRATSNGVMIGWGAASVDDPELAVGLAGLEGRAPLRIVVAGLRTYRPQMRLVTTVPERPVAIIAIPEKKLELPGGIEMIRVKGARGRPDLSLALAALAGRGVQSLLVEAGPTLTEALLTAGLVDRFHLVRSEAIIGPQGVPATGKGTMEQRLVAAGFSLVDHRLLGADNLRTFERHF